MLNNNVAFYAPNLAGGGAERIVSILAKHFAELDFTVDLLLGKAAGPYLNNIPSAVNVFNFDCEKVLFTLPQLVSYLRKNKPGVLFSSQMHSSIIALWAVKIAAVDTKVIIRQPTMLRPTYEKKSLRSKLRQKLLFWSARKWAYKVVATSQVMADEFISLSNIDPKKIAIIYNPLPIAEIRQNSEQPVDHPWFQVGQNPVILAVGRLVYVKDFQTLINAFSLVRNEVDARLMILGEGPLRADMEKLVVRLGLEDYVQMPGFDQNPFKYMKRSKVFVISSLWEGFPNSLIEAMACGTHVIATNCDGGAAEILEHGKWGQLVLVQNSKDMAKNILNVLQTDNMPSAQERADNFVVDDIVKKYATLFAS